MRNLLLSFSLALFLISCKSNSSTPAKSDVKDDVAQGYIIEKIAAPQLADYKNRLHHLFDSMLLPRGFNGSILVAKGGNILYENYTGYKNPAAKTDSINEHTTFHLASTSKPFTAMAVLKLVEQEKLQLNDDIMSFFTGFPYSGVTVAQLLSHRSGLPNYLYFMDSKHWDPKKSPSNQDVLDFMIKNIPPSNYKPGTHFSYCNTNYVLLALIVEKVTGKKFPQYLKETIFDPLQMHETFVYTDADSANVIMSYKPSNAVWPNDQFERTYGDKNVYSTPHDLMKWDAALYDNHFLRQSLLDSAYQPQSNEKPSIHNYGLGWRMLNLKNGKHVIYHNGKWHGFTPAFSRLIEERTVIIILGNKANKSIYETAKAAYNIFGNYFESEPSTDEENATTEAASAIILPPPPSPRPNTVKKEVPNKKVVPVTKVAPTKKAVVTKAVPNKKKAPVTKVVPAKKTISKATVVKTTAKPVVPKKRK